MTRENKLALIIGFSLILVVAILITDHLSPAQSVEFANLGPRSGSASSLELRATLPSGRGARNFVDTGDSGNQSAIESRYHNDPEGTSSSAGESRARRVEPPRVINLQPGQVAAQLAVTAREPIEMGVPIERDQPRRFSRFETTGNVRLHPVQSGESLYGITRKYYGEITLAQALADYNQGRVRPNLQLRAGVTLRIPERWVLSGGPAPVQSPTPRAKPVPAGPEYTSYTIKSNDTLGEISLALLGTSKRWREIYELNDKIIANPDHLIPGETIRIPARR